MLSTAPRGQKAQDANSKTYGQHMPRALQSSAGQCSVSAHGKAPGKCTVSALQHRVAQRVEGIHPASATRVNC